MKKISLAQVIRRVIQIAAFFLFPGLFISIFHSIPNLISAIAGGTFSMAANGTDLVLLLAVIPLTVLWGRFFCGYLCALGSVQDLFYQIRKRLFREKAVPAGADRLLKYGKFAVLIFCVVVLWTGLWNMPAAYSPWTLFGLIAAGNFAEAAKSLLTPGMLIFAVAMIASFFFERFFCRYLCPLGGIFALISRPRLFRIRRNPDRCIDCGICDRKCSMGIEVSGRDAVTSGECIDCFECLKPCPRQALSARPNEAVCGTAASAVMLGLVACGNIAVPAAFGEGSASGTVSESGIGGSPQKTGSYTDGTYKGSGTGFRGKIAVTVTVSGGKITGIEVNSSSDDAQFFNRAQSGVVSAILQEQTPDVDTVTGATYSSNGIIEAVKNALSGNASDTEQNTDQDTDQGSTDQNANQNTDQDSADQNADQNEQNAGSVQDVKDGTYTGTGNGYRGEVRMKVTVSGGKITAIETVSASDDDRFYSQAESGVIQEILDQQSVDVDAVSGATYSSNGIMEAVADALNIEFTAQTPSNSGGHGNQGFRHGFHDGTDSQDW